MSDDTQAHLIRWCMAMYGDGSESFAAYDRISSFVREHPDTLETRSWPEIDAMASR